MITSEDKQVDNCSAETLGYARSMLSGKRIAFIGFGAEQASRLAEIIGKADAFSRQFSAAEHSPDTASLQPFELLVLSAEGCQGTRWLKDEDLRPVVDRSLVLCHPTSALNLVATSEELFMRFCAEGCSADEFLLRAGKACTPRLSAKIQAPVISNTVVLADDDVSITALLRVTLERNGFKCQAAPNGGEALRLIRATKPVAAVVDVNMPQMDGFELLSLVRNDPETAATKMILLTGCEQEVDILRGFSLGADDYVIKPFNPMELLVRLKRSVGRFS